MAKKKTTKPGSSKKRYPSRANTAYVNIPKTWKEAVKALTKKPSDHPEWHRRSAAFMVRLALEDFFRKHGLSLPPE